MNNKLEEKTKEIEKGINKKVERIKVLPEPDAEISFQDWQKTIKDNFPDLLVPAEIIMSIITQILILDITNPFGIVLVGNPSSGKTIVINFFADLEDITYCSDKFTAASFVSNAANVKKEKLDKIDLLPRIRFKTFLVRDMATFFSKREEDLTESIGIMTRLLDGEGLSTDTGVHGQRSYKGDFLFMMVSASTPITNRVWKIMGTIGSRLFFYNIFSRDKSEKELARQLMDSTYKRKEEACRVATGNLIKTLWCRHQAGINWNKSEENENYLIIIARCANLLARLRGVIHTNRTEKSNGEDGNENYEFLEPIIEKPDRINQLLYNLGRGHAAASRRSSIDTQDLAIILEIALGSAPSPRPKLFKKLVETEGKLNTSEVKAALECSEPTALKQMRVLENLGICEITTASKTGEKEIRLKEEFQWFLNDEYKQIRGLLSEAKIVIDQPLF